MLQVHTGCFNKKYPITPSSILSQSQAFSTESNQSQSSIHVDIMVPRGTFLLKHPVLGKTSSSGYQDTTTTLPQPPKEDLLSLAQGQIQILLDISYFLSCIFQLNIRVEDIENIFLILTESSLLK